MPLCGCCFTGDPNKDPFVDADKIIKDFAWRRITLSWWQRLCRQQFELEVDWGSLGREHDIESFTLRDSAQPARSKAQQKAKKAFARDQCLFRTEFTNDTDTEQFYTFRTERQTVSSCDISVSKSYQIGGKLDVKVSIPLPGQQELKAALGDKVDLCDVTGGLSGQFQLTKREGTAYSETLTWSVDTQIKVSSQTKTTASLHVVEKTFEAEYVIRTTIKPIKSGVMVYFRHKQSGDVITNLKIDQGGFASLFADKSGFIVDKDTSSVACLTKGSLRAVYGAEQKIKITHQPLVKIKSPQAPAHVMVEEVIEELSQAQEVRALPAPSTSLEQIQEEAGTRVILETEESTGQEDAEEDPLVSKNSSA